MEFYTELKAVLKKREIAILAMERKLNKANSLNRTLLDALSSSIQREDMLNYDERAELKAETKSLCRGVDNEVLMQGEKVAE